MNRIPYLIFGCIVFFGLSKDAIAYHCKYHQKLNKGAKLENEKRKLLHNRFFTFDWVFTECNAQNYLAYHIGFAEAEELIVNEKFSEAESILDGLFAGHEVKFVKDYLIAAQISFLNSHKNKAFDHLRHALKKGVKLECIKSIHLFNKNIVKEEWEELEKASDQFRKTYLESIDLKNHINLHKRYQKEQDAKRNEHYGSVVYSNFRNIKSLVDSTGFPGEALIGLDNQSLAHSIDDCACGNSKVVVTLLHYDHPISELGLDLLVAEVKAGNLHPRELATIYIYEKSKVSKLYKNSKKEYPALPDYYFNLPFGNKSTDMERVNSDRLEFGICKYEVDEKKEAISRKYGMKLTFNYK